MIALRERRKFRRWDCSIPCDVVKPGETVQAEVINLSFNGACITRSTEEMKPGDNITVNLDSDGKKVSLPGRIVYRIREDGYYRLGVEFLGAWEAKLQSLMPLFQVYIEKEEPD